MPEIRSLSLAEDRSYDLIEQAMMESARGRRFLAEFVRRHRSADTTMLLDAIGRLEQAVAGDHVPLEPASPPFATRAGEPGSEGTAPTTPKFPGGDSEPVASNAADFETLTPAARRTIADLLGEAESLQETAWRLRESGAAAKLCAELDQCATRIFAACSSQEALAERMESAVETLRRLQAQTSAPHERNDRAAASRQDRADGRYPGSDAERLRDLACRFRHDPAGPGPNATPSIEDLDRLTIAERLELFS